LQVQVLPARHLQLIVGRHRVCCVLTKSHAAEAADPITKLPWAAAVINNKTALRFASIAHAAERLCQCGHIATGTLKATASRSFTA
jgi:hypothetical protein